MAPSWIWLNLALAAAKGALAATCGDFSVLTINVAGLPPILNSNDVPGDKATNARLIGEYLAEHGYDIVHMQEDFNYHAYIYEADTHPFRTATTGGAGIGSGLNSVANFDWIDFERVKWDDCSNSSGADCLTPKGFTFMRVKVAEGVYVDAYNVHADAGTSDADEVARNSNLQQVADYIDTWSVGNAVLVFGDTNSRYSRVLDNIRIFSEQNSLTDPWVKLIRDGEVPTEESVCENPSTTNDCEVVDKVFYRSSPLLTLQATSFNYESTRFLQPDGNILSDHNPIAVNFTWAASRSLRQSNFFGGPHGTWFSDVPVLATKSDPKAARITFRGASRLDSVAITLADGTSFTHGGAGGSEMKMDLAADEFWTAATACWGQKDGRTRNFYIKATTSAGRTLQAGTTTSDCQSVSAPSGWQIVGFMGRDGDEMDRLAFVYAPQ